MAEIEVMESVFQRNQKKAGELNKKLTDKKVFVIDVMGAPGIGKTSSLINIIKRVKYKSFVMEGDVESDIDTIKLKELGIPAVQINTKGGCHLDAPQIETAAEELKPENGLLFIENIGNLICPAEFLIGEHIKLLISSVTEGSDKPYKYPLAFEKADILLINKVDLMEHVDFNEEYFMQGVRRLNPSMAVFKVSCRTGEGFDKVAEWINKKAEKTVER